jgi:hypothetical protein
VGSRPGMGFGTGSPYLHPALAEVSVATAGRSPYPPSPLPILHRLARSVAAGAGPGVASHSTHHPEVDPPRPCCYTRPPDVPQDWNSTRPAGANPLLCSRSRSFISVSNVKAIHELRWDGEKTISISALTMCVTSFFYFRKKKTKRY